MHTQYPILRHGFVARASGCCGRLLVAILLLGSTTAFAKSSPLSIYQQAMQSLLDDAVMPKLKARLSANERSRIFSLTLEVSSSSDPRQVLMSTFTKPSHYVVSAGYMSLQDVLVDAAILADAQPSSIDELMDYSFEVAQYGQATEQSPTPATVVPRPFWSRLNWKESTYQQLRASTAYSTNRYRGAEQNVAWLAAVAIAQTVSSDTVSKRISPSVTRRNIYELAAELLQRSDWSPAPSWPVAILYASATQQAGMGAAQDWACEAKQIVEAGIAVDQRTERSSSDAALRTERQQQNEYWRRVADRLEARSRCDASTPRRK